MAEAVMMTAPRLRTIRYLAEVLGVSVSNAWKIVKDDARAPRPIRVGAGSTRFDEADIVAYVEQLKQTTQ